MVAHADKTRPDARMSCCIQGKSDVPSCHALPGS